MLLMTRIQQGAKQRGQGLLGPIHHQLRTSCISETDKTHRREYIDMAELWKENTEVEGRSQMPKECSQAQQPLLQPVWWIPHVHLCCTLLLTKAYWH